MRKVRYGRGGIAALAAVAALASATASEPPARETLGSLQAWLDGTRDLEARFRQQLLSGALGSGLDESGRLHLKRPGKMRWDYVEPERKTAIVLGSRTRLYLAEDRQLWEGTLADDERILPDLLAGERSLEQAFTAESLEPDPGGGAGLRRLALVPREAHEAYERIVVELRPPEHAIVAVEVQDAAGNRIRYEFSDVRRNPGLPDSVFDFEPPPGTEVVARP